MSVPFSRHLTTNGVGLRFQTERGTVWVFVRPLTRTTAEVDVYEERAGLAAHDDPETIMRGQVHEEERSARNRFGVALVRKVLRAVRAEFPSVVEWVYERVTGASDGRRRARR